MFSMLERMAAASSNAVAPKSAAAAPRRTSVSGVKVGRSDAAAMLGAAVLKVSSKPKAEQQQDRSAVSVENCWVAPGADASEFEMQNA